MNTYPLITIIAVCYNQEEWIEETLDSIKAQTYPNIQLIIADDASKDKSKQVIKNWIKTNNSNAVFIDHPVNLGLTKNINSAIPYVKGDYFQVFGCDDVMIPTKIEEQVAIMENDKSIGVVYSDMYMIGREGEKFDKSYFEKNEYKKPLSGYLYDDLVDRFIISAPSVLIRRNVLDELKGYNESLIYEDHDFFLRAAKNHHFFYMPGKTVLYRFTGTSLSTQPHFFKFYVNTFLIYYQNFDDRKQYKQRFSKKLLFYTKKLYDEKFKYGATYFTKAFFKTGDLTFLKFAVASLPFYFTSNKK